MMDTNFAQVPEEVVERVVAEHYQGYSNVRGSGGQHIRGLLTINGRQFNPWETNVKEFSGEKDGVLKRVVTDGYGAVIEVEESPVTKGD